MHNKKFNLLTTSAIIVSLMIAPLAEAKRVGGGGNRGMSRSYSGQSYQRSNSYQPQRSYQPQQRQQPQQNGNGVGRMVGAGVAGAAIGALAGHALANNQNEANNQDTVQASGPTTETQNLQQPAETPSHGSSMNWVLLIILVLGGLFLYRRFKNKNQASSNPMQQNNFTHLAGNPANQNHGSTNTNVFGQQLNNAHSNNQTLADGSSNDVFLRFARQRFNHVQSMNMGANLEEIRRYFTPDMFNSIKEDIAHNQETAEFSNLQTELVDSIQENGQYIASVRFSGLVSEDVGSPATPFSEVWHFVKPVGSQQDWLIAGIQQD